MACPTNRTNTNRRSRQDNSIKPKSCDYFIDIFKALIVLISPVIAISLRHVCLPVVIRLLICSALFAVSALFCSVYRSRTTWLRKKHTILIFALAIIISVTICIVSPAEYGLKGQIASEDGKSIRMMYFPGASSDIGYGTITDDNGNWSIKGAKKGSNNVMAIAANDNSIRYSEFVMLAATRNRPPRKCPKPLKQCKLYKWDMVHFERDSARLSYDDLAKIHKMKERLMKEFYGVNYRLLILGHTSAIGSDKSNLMLGCQRAKVVRDELLKGPFNPERIRSVTFGERDLMDFGDGTLNHARNRRVEFLLLPYGPKAEQMMTKLRLDVINVFTTDT